MTGTQPGPRRDVGGQASPAQPPGGGGSACEYRVRVGVDLRECVTKPALNGGGPPGARQPRRQERGEPRAGSGGGQKQQGVNR